VERPSDGEEVQEDELEEGTEGVSLIVV